MSAAQAKSFDELLTPAEVAKMLGMSVGWVRDHAARACDRRKRRGPVIPVVRMGSAQRQELRFLKSDVEAFIRQNRVDGSESRI